MARILLLGGTGTIGRATLQQLLSRGHEVRLALRDTARVEPRSGVERVKMSVADADAWPDLMQGVDAVISCMASRTGVPADAFAIDRDAHLLALRAAEHAGVGSFVLLSAICVQKPRLAFQFAKLEFEQALMRSKINWSIVRSTAYFKSLVGQVDRVRSGKPYLLFRDGRGTACLPISDADLGRYLVDCVSDPRLWRQVLPIGGPGPAITPRDIGDRMFERLGLEPRFRSVPPGLLRAIAAGLDIAGLVVPNLRDRAELARIGHYYATESMLLWDGRRYDARATPSFGQDSFVSYLDAVIDGQETAERGDHAVF